MPDDTVTLVLEGPPEEQGHVRLDEMITKLAALKDALKETERVVTGDRRELYYRVIDLKHSSPAQITVQGIARQAAGHETPERVMGRFKREVRQIRRFHHASSDFDSFALEALLDLAPGEKKRSSVSITDETAEVTPIDSEFRDSLKKLIGQQQEEHGSLMGKLEALNVHHTANQFTIYPTVGPKRVVCKFLSALREKVLASAGKYVRVSGWAIYRPEQKFPHLMRVTDLEVFPQEEATKLGALRKIAPQATGGESPEEFVRKRREW